MKMGLGAKLTTGLSLTPQMQQAIRLLQLSSLELEQEVQAKLDSNPLLEREEDWESEPNADDFLQAGKTESEFGDNFDSNLTSDFKEVDNEFSDNFDKNFDSDFDDFSKNSFEDNWKNSSLSMSLDEDFSYDNDNAFEGEWGSDGDDSTSQFESNQLGDMVIDTQWDEVYTHEPTGLSQVDTSEISDDYKFSTQGTIQDHVRWQLNFKHLSDLEMMMAEYLIDSMDDMGFITLSTEDLFRSLDTMLSFYQMDDELELDPSDIEVVVKHIQNCEPLGVGARNLAECLTIQLNRLPADTPYLSQAKKLLQYPDYFVSNNINALLKATNLSLDDIPKSLELIRTLDPNPALSYAKTQEQFDFAPDSYDVPDVLVSQDKKGWHVQLNPETLPKLRVNQEYASLISKNDDSPQNVYLKEHLVDARLFIRSIEERNQNLLKVATCIVKRQQAFFEEGVMAMQPMILKDVADEVELHESTVSRITTSKTMLTPKGLFSLKYFFSSQVTSEDGEGVSSTAISAKIKQMIDEEDPKKPLSDSTIMDILKKEGIDIARRTVTKYREAMNIGSSTQRKQRF